MNERTDPEKILVPFRKHRGKSIMDLAREDEGPGYLKWAQDATDWGNHYKTVILEAVRQATNEKIEAAPPISLTEHQHEVAETLLAKAAPGRVLLLDGGAGYGKSFVTKFLATELVKRGFSIHATAVSYVATQVLAAQLDPYNIPAATMARTLRFTKVFRDGREEYLHSDDTPFEAAAKLTENQALIVDECSMVKDEDASLLINTVRKTGGLLICVGDSAQLPPVGQPTTGKLCLPQYCDAHATLSVPMRYNTESPLYQVEQTARTNPYGLQTVVERLQQSASLERAINAGHLLKIYQANYAIDPGALHRMLLFRRADVNAANNQVRKWLFGPEADGSIIKEDEQLMVLATTDTPYSPEDAYHTDRYYSGQTFQVSALEKADYVIRIDKTDYRIPHYKVRFNNGRPPVRIMFGITENRVDENKFGGIEFQRALQAAVAFGQKQDAQQNRVGSWEPYKQLQHDFVRVAYTYATSVHRAQGQTLDYAYCQPESLLAVRGIMGRALAYVACTRAKKKLALVL